MLLRIRSILVASDLSEGAGEVVHCAAELAALAEAELHVMHSRPGITKGESEEVLDAVRDQVRSHTHDLRVKTRSYVGRIEPDAAIAQYAEEVDADLIVIGPHRGRPGEERELGTTADRVVRTSAVPCLVMHGPLRLPLRKMLVPSDLSPASDGAFEIALNWGAALRVPTSSGEQTRLFVLQVIRPSTEGSPSPEEWSARDRALREHTDAVATRHEGRIPLDIQRMLVYGPYPANEIVRFSSENQIDLVIMGTHGENPVTRAAIGSVSSAVTRRSQRPVLLVPPALWRRSA
jgi:universal stress protein E